MPSGVYQRTDEHRRKNSEGHKGKKLSDETKKKLSENNPRYWSGKHLPEEMRRKISETLKKGGYRPPSSLGRHLSEEMKKKIGERMKGNKYSLGKHPSEETKRKLSKALKGRVVSEETRKKLSKALTGRKFSAEWIRKIGEASKGRKLSKAAREKISEANRGANSYSWKGGITPLVGQIRRSWKYRQWRSDVFTRDDFTCQICGKRGGGELVAHHIKPFNLIIEENNIRTFQEALDCEELWDINNGITLNKEIHYEFHKRYGWENNNREQLDEFLLTKSK